MNTNIVKAKKVSIGDIIVYDGNSFNVKYIEYDYTLMKQIISYS